MGTAWLRSERYTRDTVRIEATLAKYLDFASSESGKGHKVSGKEDATGLEDLRSIAVQEGRGRILSAWATQMSESAYLPIQKVEGEKTHRRC